MRSCLLIVSKYSSYWPTHGLNTKKNTVIGSHNPFPSNTNSTHTPRTKTRTPEISSPIDSPSSSGHVDVFSFETFNVLRLSLPEEGGIFFILLKPACVSHIHSKPNTQYTKQRAGSQEYSQNLSPLSDLKYNLRRHVMCIPRYRDRQYMRNKKRRKVLLFCFCPSLLSYREGEGNTSINAICT